MAGGHCLPRALPRRLAHVHTGCVIMHTPSQPFAFLRLNSTGQFPAPAPQFQCGQPPSSLSTVYTATSRDLENEACPGSPLPSQE